MPARSTPRRIFRPFPRPFIESAPSADDIPCACRDFLESLAPLIETDMMRTFRLLCFRLAWAGIVTRPDDLSPGNLAHAGMFPRLRRPSSGCDLALRVLSNDVGPGRAVRILPNFLDAGRLPRHDAYGRLAIAGGRNASSEGWASRSTRGTTRRAAAVAFQELGKAHEW